MIPTIIVAFAICVIICYCIKDNENHWKQVEFQAELLQATLEKKNKAEDERWIPISQVEEINDEEETENEMEEQDFLDEVI